MKKFVIILAVVVIAFAGFLTWRAYQPMPIAAETEGPAMTEEAAEIIISELDYEAIKALYDEDQVIMTVRGRDVTWGEYFPWYEMNAVQIQLYFEQMAMYYGVAADWSGSVGDGSGMIYADLPGVSAEDYLLRFAAIEDMAEEKGVSLSEASLAALEDEALAAAVCGEGASLEDLQAALDELDMSLDSYKRISTVNYLAGDMLTAQYGANFELVDDEAVGEWLSQQGYMAANHILFMTMDKDTGTAVDEAAKAEKKAQAQKIYEELVAIEDTQQLLERFLELKDEYDEDTGKLYYPNGYTFTSGTMVAEFENAVKSLDVYGVSEPVESSYGYHVILCMPLDGKCTLSDASGNFMTAASVFANNEMTEELNSYMDKEEIVYAEGFEGVNALDFIKK